MNAPYFYIADNEINNSSITPDEATQKHIAKVLRMKIGELCFFTDGKGNLLEGKIENDRLNKISISITKKTFLEKPKPEIHIAVSPLKNFNRFEWALEKLTEIGVSSITPLLCERTESKNYKQERWENIIKTAMLQSQQTWMPALTEPRSFEKYVNENYSNTEKFIAHCVEENKKELAKISVEKKTNKIILIGPEGDFTEKEIALALDKNFLPVGLGNTRLRTETAAVVASIILKQIVA